MRIPPQALVKLAFVAALALAAPAASQQAGGLKGPKGDDKPPADQPPAPAGPPAPLTPLASPVAPGPAPTPAQAADQCRTVCARNYYFCLSGDTPDDCPNAWSQCRLTCNGSLSGG